MRQLKFTIISISLLVFTSLNAQDGLVAHWSFDTIIFNQFIDHVTNEFAGTVYGGQTVPGPVGNALEFNGISNYARVPGDGEAPPDVISKLSKGSISVWFRVDQIPLTYGIRPIFYYGRENACNFFDAANEGMIIEVGHSPIHNGSRRLYFTEWTNGCTFPSFCYDSWNPIIEGAWYHYVAVVGDDFNTGYLNGQLMTDRKYNFGNASTHEFFSDALAHENLWIGRGYWDSNDMFFDGAIDEIKIFDRPLIQADVDSLYQEGFPAPPVGLQQNNEQSGPYLYPNPAGERINLDFSHSIDKPLTFKVYNSSGSIVFQEEFSGFHDTKRIDLSGLPKGLYIYSLEEGSRILNTDKLIIQ